jgi:hypothetical protein
MVLLGVIVTSVAILFLLSAMALWSSRQLPHPVRTMALLGAVLMVGLALLLE